MKSSLANHLLRREHGDISGYSGIKGIYGLKTWIDELDITDELGGHRGCINALSWSSSGRLLASGSDDRHLNIYKYQPESFASQFAFSTTVATGHTANIFSVKFMPHSNDATLVTCAGDSEVRVFDIEHSPVRSTPSAQTSGGIGWGLNHLYHGVRYLSEANTRARIYKSHTDRVKRIVTESSPYLFLTCSEDGEVRQFDLRLPSPAYPAPRGHRRLFPHPIIHKDPNVPPPLISYKRYQIDLNTISCSASQPHYIALGGAHLHCFLHDRRMLGRDVLDERGDPGSNFPASGGSLRENELMGQATQCVRKFAPGGQMQMRSSDNGNITACKISDSNPNELIVSWAADHIYSFDLIKSPDATETLQEGSEKRIKGTSSGKMRESVDRKQKRRSETLSDPAESQRPSSEDGQLSTSRKDDGSSEEISVEDQVAAVIGNSENLNRVRSTRISRSVSKVSSLIFSLDARTRDLMESAEIGHHIFTSQFTSILGYAATCLPEMDEMISSWRYPMNPLREDVYLQQSLRSDREASRRFVQAAGTLARLLGGRLHTVSLGSNPLLQSFQRIGPTPKEGLHITRAQVFCYEFLKAITLWLDGSRQALLDGFKRPGDHGINDSRYPVPCHTGLSGIDEYIIPYLLQLSQGNPIPNVDASRFEKDESRQLFRSETAAVVAFSHAIRTELGEASSNFGETPLQTPRARQTAMKFWGFKVGRGLLLNATRDTESRHVDIAFGGPGVIRADGRIQTDIDPEEEGSDQSTHSRVESPLPAASDDPGGDSQPNRDTPTNGPSHSHTSLEFSVNAQKTPHDQKSSHDSTDPGRMERWVESPAISTTAGTEDPIQGARSNGDMATNSSSSPSNMSHEATTDAEGIESDANVVLMEDIHDTVSRYMDAGYDVEDVIHEEEDADAEEDDDGDEEGMFTRREPQLLIRTASERSKLRESLFKDVGCSSHTRQYSGHCNVKTVKDANFFGLQDEYVVSGSDSGHVFIWDKKTSELVNILKGDDDVVNVIQGHPYEPLLAVSGIENTIKIFSPDSRAQADARGEITSDSSDDYSKGNIPAGQRRSQGLASRKCMDRCYQIITNNDQERRGGLRDAFVARDVLAQIAAWLHARQTGGDGDGSGEESLEGTPVVVDGNCVVS